MYTCPICANESDTIIYRQENVPVNSCILCQTDKQALDFRRGDINLCYCSHCSFIFNGSFDPSLINYSEDYEETQGFSPTFQEFHKELAVYLIEKYHLTRKRILEIGCGKGEFLSLICELGSNQGIGIDPAFVPGRKPGTSDVNIEFIQEFYSSKHSGIQADAVICKMTLEHIFLPGKLLQLIRKSLGDHCETPMFFMIPNAERIIGEGAFEDIYYEHCCYFTESSLRYLFTSTGFKVIHIQYLYNNQYVTVEAKPAPIQEKLLLSEKANDLESVKLTAFGEKIRLHRSRWENLLKEGNKKWLIWGAGSKCTAFLFFISDISNIEAVIDINPYKQGSYVAGTNKIIISPEDLRYQESVDIIIMNDIYSREIYLKIKAMELDVNLYTLTGGLLDTTGIS